MQPLTGVRVVDFSTLLPGPLATLILAEAGAEVIKIERPEGGDDMRRYAPAWGQDSAGFALLNRGKRSVSADLKNPESRNKVRELARDCDVLVEQFRPGVMARLGLDFETLQTMNPRLVYCSISGYGQSGPRAGTAGHDLNYLAAAGMLALGADRDGRPQLPAGLIADIGGGAYPAVMNILLALRARDDNGCGCHLDISMTDNLMTWMVNGLADGFGGAAWPQPARGLLNGGSPRYQLYATSDAQYIAAAPIEQKFWESFCDAIQLETEFRDDSTEPQRSIAAVTARIAQHPAAHWQRQFSGRDVCCTLMATLQQAVEQLHATGSELLRCEVKGFDGEQMPALPVPLAPQWRGEEVDSYPPLGEANSEYFDNL
ncbi:MAG: CoA transferase [Gammaproteobacteria bacterium]|nr:CoA transferase [Gammaproteobacteria bacterium]MDH3466572.1 CoA transferase [Gammaproteobacteria bacterium]